jgi:uncharacterized protein with NRDE domain
MCLVAIFFQVVDDAAVVAGANREEAFARGGEPPRIHPGSCPFVAGVDPKAKGTWLGVNEKGLLIAVTNRPRSQVPRNPRSRGLLAVDLLGCESSKVAVDLAYREVTQGGYAGCNILCADRDGAYVIHAGNWPQVVPLAPGLHVLTMNDVNDSRDPRILHARKWLAKSSYETANQCVDALQKLCAQNGSDGPVICLRGPLGGTVSSSIIALRSPLTRTLYLHAQGPPDTTPYQDYSHLMQELASKQTNGAI